MTTYDAVIIGAGLGGLTCGALLARAGRKVLVIEKSNSVGGAASSYKVGDLFVEGSLHETSDPTDPRDPKHEILKRAGVLDAVKWIPGGAFFEVRGGPVGVPLSVPDNFAGARDALTARFPHHADGIAELLSEMERFAAGAPENDSQTSLADRLQQIFGNDEAVKCAIAANLSYYHDDPATLWWPFFAAAQGSYLQSGGRYVQNGSQRLSSALARVVIKSEGCGVVVRRVVTAIEKKGDAFIVSHTAKDGSDPKTAEAIRVISNAAPESTVELLAQSQRPPFLSRYRDLSPSISVFALTLGLAKPPRDFGFTSYSTQLLPDWMTSLADYAKAAALMADEPAARMPPLAMADYAAIDSGVPAPPYVLSVIAPDRLSNWTGIDHDAYRAKRGRWQDAIIAYLDAHYPGLAKAVVASSFNTAMSVRQYLGAPNGAVYGFAPTVPRSTDEMAARSPATAVPGLYLSSSYAGFGGYTGAIQAAGACADLILRES
ncbi:MAG: NAD(P)/FAD-dependent oxidoreductase [Bradyrhizobiaceae bacterium]|nr:MAG: NAD(P)/FAD-dependent oxidoreductase [Bradyrhizobiaceae bacterium]